MRGERMGIFDVCEGVFIIFIFVKSEMMRCGLNIMCHEVYAYIRAFL